MNTIPRDKVGSKPRAIKLKDAGRFVGLFYCWFTVSLLCRVSEVGCRVSRGQRIFSIGLITSTSSEEHSIILFTFSALEVSNLVGLLRQVLASRTKRQRSASYTAARFRVNDSSGRQIGFVHNELRLRSRRTS